MYLLVSLTLVLIAILPSLAGWHGTVVQSGSMEPHVSPGDVVLTVPLPDDQPVPVGGVIEYRTTAEAEPSGEARTRLHRIIEANDDGTFVTAGDANPDVDSVPLERSQITGQARLLIPHVGLPGLWVSKGQWPPLALWAVLTLVALATTPASKSTEQDTTNTVEARGPLRLLMPTMSRVLRGAAALAVLLALAGLVIATTTAFSTAAFTARTINATNTFSAAPDWTPPSVTMISPGPSIQASVNLTAEASDTQTGIRSVAIEYLPAAGTTWAAVCTITTAPYTCAWNTQAVQDGPYRLRATATNTIGLNTTSPEVSTTVANAFAITLAPPGGIQRGTVNLSATLSGSGSRAYSVRMEYALAGTNQWRTLCSNLAARQ
jgi:signal peptidase I